MAEENIKQFTISWIVVGLLLFCLLTFTFTFMLNNNPSGLGTEANVILGVTESGVESRLLQVEGDSDDLLNITANTDPERSELDSRDSVATGYGYRETSVSFWQGTKIFISWVFSGDVGKVLISVISGILGFLSVYYIVKFIRQGL